MAVKHSVSKGRVKVQLDSALNIYGAMEAKPQLLAALAAGKEIEVDLSSVEDLDTTGVQLLLLLKREAARQQKRCVFRQPGPAVREIMDLLNLADELADPDSGTV